MNDNENNNNVNIGEKPHDGDVQMVDANPSPLEAAKAVINKWSQDLADKQKAFSDSALSDATDEVKGPVQPLDTLPDDLMLLPSNSRKTSLPLLPWPDPNMLHMPLKSLKRLRISLTPTKVSSPMMNSLISILLTAPLIVSADTLKIIQCLTHTPL
ncbi:hypothetical protein [Absidia glauca]|uniref:Uncharacterized protein n=1 Tax=Absidia glauca TaxID=4829 RepID=A0A168N9M7_ABSGL|nr:hypothetical protein [Absidia glauca]